MTSGPVSSYPSSAGAQCRETLAHMHWDLFVSSRASVPLEEADKGWFDASWSALWMLNKHANQRFFVLIFLAVPCVMQGLSLPIGG